MSIVAALGQQGAGSAPAPAILTESFVSDDKATVTWSGLGDGNTTGYGVYKDTVLVTTLDGASHTHFTYTGLTAATTYDFHVVAVGGSATSNTVTTTTEAAYSGEGAVSRNDASIDSTLVRQGSTSQYIGAYQLGAAPLTVDWDSSGGRTANPISSVTASGLRLLLDSTNMVWTIDFDEAIDGFTLVMFGLDTTNKKIVVDQPVAALYDPVTSAQYVPTLSADKMTITGMASNAGETHIHVGPQAANSTLVLQLTDAGDTTMFIREIEVLLG